MQLRLALPAKRHMLLAMLDVHAKDVFVLERLTLASMQPGKSEGDQRIVAEHNNNNNNNCSNSLSPQQPIVLGVVLQKQHHFIQQLPEIHQTSYWNRVNYS
jgi:hypothetical protein